MRIPAYTYPSYLKQERRKQLDRRSRPTSLYDCFFSPRLRRRGFRRRGEGVNRYVDHLRLPIVLWVAALLALSMVDAALTLAHVQLGGKELVPTMRWALDQGMDTFISAKLLLTAVGAVYLAAHQNFPMARLAYRTLMGAYLGLMVYHLSLVVNHW
ncbi:MAG: hypothetical protein HY717_09315 [Planctomycetes bacterium]|nr:hypothetical protein [Planctomycetota bacterium]